MLNLFFFCFPVYQSDLTKQQNGFKITLKTLEDNLLSRLSAASGNFLGDTELVENLETTKRTAAEIEEKVLFFFIFTHPTPPPSVQCNYQAELIYDQSIIWVALKKMNRMSKWRINTPTDLQNHWWPACLLDKRSNLMAIYFRLWKTVIRFFLYLLLI